MGAERFKKKNVRGQIKKKMERADKERVGEGRKKVGEGRERSGRGKGENSGREEGKKERERGEEWERGRKDSDSDSDGLLHFGHRPRYIIYKHKNGGHMRIIHSTH